MTATLQTGPQVSLAFRDNATTETGFNVERADNGSGVFVQIGALPARATTGTVNLTDTGVVAGNTYAYRANAWNGAGSSAYSNTATVILPSLPSVPTGLVATAVRAGTTDTVTLNWTDTPNETAYTIQRANNAAFSNPITSFSALANVVTLKDTGLARNRTYYYRILSANLMGLSGWSTTASVTTP
jgi:hypothetical protein